jgi:hypothetical protein
MRSQTYYFALALFTTMLNGPNVAQADDTLLFQDSFAEMKGHVIRQANGKITVSGQAATRQVYPFMGMADSAVGELVIKAFEDDKTQGPDGKPGVLSILYKSVTKEAAYSGFAYLGGVSREKFLTLKELLNSPTSKRLERIKLTFKYRAANSINVDDIGASYACRFEPLVEDSYNKRIDFGVIHATSKWRTFEATLDQGENVVAFLESIIVEEPKGFKIIWGQDGLITNYQAGDTLLIDDLRIYQLR